MNGGVCGHLSLDVRRCDRRQHTDNEPHENSDKTTGVVHFWATCGRRECVARSGQNRFVVNHSYDCKRRSAS